MIEILKHPIFIGVMSFCAGFLLCYSFVLIDKRREQRDKRFNKKGTNHYVKIPGHNNPIPICVNEQINRGHEFVLDRIAYIVASIQHKKTGEVIFHLRHQVL